MTDSHSVVDTGVSVEDAPEPVMIEAGGDSVSESADEVFTDDIDMDKCHIVEARRKPDGTLTWSVTCPALSTESLGMCSVARLCHQCLHEVNIANSAASVVEPSIPTTDAVLPAERLVTEMVHGSLHVGLGEQPVYEVTPNVCGFAESLSAARTEWLEDIVDRHGDVMLLVDPVFDTYGGITAGVVVRVER